MKVVLTSTSSGARGGGEIFLIHLGEALKRLGHEPVLWCATHKRMDELAGLFEPIGQVVRDPYPNSYLDRSTRAITTILDRSLITRISKRFIELDPDIIHVNKQTLEDGFDLMLAAEKSKLPYLTTIHMTQSNRLLGAKMAWLRDSQSRYVLKRSNTTFTVVSDLRYRELCDFLGTDNIHTVYNAVRDVRSQNREENRQKLLAETSWPSTSLIATCQARLVSQKDPLRFLDLANQLRGMEPDARFMWIGDGDLRGEFLSKAQSLGLGDHVFVTGWQEHPDRYLNAADIYLHPAAYEGLPLSILEAMSVGLPCIISRGVAKETDVFTEESFIFCDDDTDQWVREITEPAGRSKFGVAARALFESCFRLDVMGEKFVNLYRDQIRET